MQDKPEVVYNATLFIFSFTNRLIGRTTDIRSAYIPTNVENLPE